jgi:hypothetical protein
LVLLQAPRVLVAPLLTALGRPRDLLIGKACELAFVAVAVFASGVPTLAWAMGIWLVREAVALPVTVRMLRNVTGFGLLDQFRGALVPFAAAAVMTGAVLGARYALPEGLAPLLRLLVLVPIGALAFMLACYLLSRQLVKSLLDFAQVAMGRKPRSAPEAPATLALGRAP